MADLRATLQSLADGALPTMRGHVIRPEDAAITAPFAGACARLVRESRHDGERLTAPAALLQPLP